MSRDAAGRTDLALRGWSVCPGCGVALPGLEGDLHGRGNASEACWQLYGEVSGYEAAHVAVLGRLHQLMVDAYAAQHAGEPAPPISVAFGLIGLRLTLDEDWSGDHVRDAHRYLAGSFREWPAFDRPSRPATLTVFDIAMAGSPAAHAELVQRWAAEVWSSWQAAHGEVLALIERRLPVEVRSRLLGRS